MKDFEIRKYTIRLRKEALKAPMNKRSKRAVVGVKKFIEKNTRAKSSEILIGEELNNAIWTKGITNPPSKVEVFVQKLPQSKKIFVNLQGMPLRIEKEKKEDKKDKKAEKSLEDIAQESKTEDNKSAEESEKPKEKIELKKPKKSSN